MKHPLALSGFLLLAVLGSPLCAQTLNWGSPIGTLITDSNGDGVDDTFIFELGAFALDFTPDEDNVEDWALNWKMFDTATYNPAFGYLTSTVHVVGDVSGGVTSSNPAADPGNFSGLVAYLWIRNSDQPVEGSEWLVVRADNWTFPVTAGDCCDTSVIEWSISDLDTGDTPLWGRHRHHRHSRYANLHLRAGTLKRPDGGPRRNRRGHAAPAQRSLKSHDPQPISRRNFMGMHHSSQCQHAVVVLRSGGRQVRFQ